MIHPRRSFLFMPGSNARALEKAPALPADGIILDLEDAVAPDAKVIARSQIARAVTAGGFGTREVLVRLNGLDTPWWSDDLAMAGKARPNGIVLPKVSRAADLSTLFQALSEIGADRNINLWAMIETPLGVLNAPGIAAGARDVGISLAGFIIGTNDIARETRISQVPGRAPMLPALSLCILAARGYGLDVLDGVYNNFNDVEGFVQECAQARDMGFDGKTLIHPNQIKPCNAAFTPTTDEVAHAREIIRLFALPENADKGAIQINGQMVERLHVQMAQRVVAIADAIASDEKVG
jgi:citrate lyase subunit beta/citryl-CoA lyase